MVAEPVSLKPQIHEHVVYVSKWRHPGSSRRSRKETEPITQEKINQETEYINIPQNQHTDKVVDVTVVRQETVHQNQTMHKRAGEETQ